LIAYGAPVLSNPGSDYVTSIGAQPGGYHLVVARFEPENHLHTIIKGFCSSSARLPLLIVGSAPYNAGYAAELIRLAGDDCRVRFLGAVWDQQHLDQLYANAATYLHGHSVGGTNPSLLRAMGAAAPVIAYDVVFNHEVAGDSGRFFSGAESLGAAVMAAEHDPDGNRQRGRIGRARVAERYEWEDVVTKYEELCHALLGHPQARRTHLPVSA
jgi:glycosyltransferase involved in cell wall biosynthesis